MPATMRCLALPGPPPRTRKGRGFRGVSTARDMWNCLSSKAKSEVLRLASAGGSETALARSRRASRGELRRWSLAEETRISRAKRMPGLQGGLHASGVVLWSLTPEGWAVAAAAWCPQPTWHR